MCKCMNVFTLSSAFSDCVQAVFVPLSDGMNIYSIPKRVASPQRVCDAVRATRLKFHRQGMAPECTADGGVCCLMQQKQKLLIEGMICLAMPVHAGVGDNEQD